MGGAICLLAAMVVRGEAPERGGAEGRTGGRSDGRTVGRALGGVAAVAKEDAGPTPGQEPEAAVGIPEVRPDVPGSPENRVAQQQEPT
jgi:hypothetical protein